MFVCACVSVFMTGKSPAPLQQLSNIHCVSSEVCQYLKVVIKHEFYVYYLLGFSDTVFRFKGFIFVYACMSCPARIRIF